MKKDGMIWVAVITVFFLGFLTGMYTGRIMAREPVSIQSLQTQTQPGRYTFPLNVGDGKLDINTASADDFDMLPGIGPVLARRIVEYRQAHGPFESIGDLQKVSGIGESILQEIEAFIKVEDLP